MFVSGITGHVVAKIETPAGAIIIGGKGPNTYDLDSMGDVALVIDLGGENTYHDGTVSDRPAAAGERQPGRPQRLSLGEAGRARRVDPRRLDDRQHRGRQPLRRQRSGPGLDHRRRGDHRRVRRREHLSRRAAGAGPGDRRRGNHHQPRRRQQLPRRHVGPGARRPAGLRHPRRHRRQRPLLPGRAVYELLQA